MVAERIAPGVSTEEIDQWIYDYTIEHGGTPADLGYGGFPKACAVHQRRYLPRHSCKEDVLKEGDIVNIDCSTILDGYYSDSSRMFYIGEVSPERRRLVEETKKAVEAGLAAIKPWGLLGDVAPPYTNTPKRRAIRSCANTADTAVASNSTKTRS